MTAPIDIACPFCASMAGNYCTAAPTDPKHQYITFHHAERVDAAARQSDRAVRHDPTRLREALRETLTLLQAYVEGCNATDDRQRLAELRKELNL